ncbi:tripartite tricarboxylate transporter substrate-binding protein [Elioraea sp.]|uniref:tripartite tricarboxylate transporter substrate-binding protein n=1 Tax=Elioraea sp. TaxID=2185103 RepID=UPI003F710D08
MDRAWDAVVLAEADDVAMALADLAPGPVRVRIGAAVETLTLAAPVPLGHKFARRAIAAGAPVRKYGAPIGVATPPRSRPARMCMCTTSEAAARSGSRRTPMPASPITRRSLAAAAATLALIRPARAAWPDRPIRIIVPFAPGGGTDTTARIIATPLAERLGQSVVVENRPGAGGAIGMAAAARAEPDGYTLVMGHFATHVVNMAVHRTPGYDTARDFIALGITSTSSNILAVNPQRHPALDSLAAFVAAAKARPGELSYGSAGVGSPAHITTAMFLRTAGITAQHVPYRGGAPATADLVGGNLDFMFSGASDSIPHIRAGRLRGLAAASRQRLASMPELPTVAESGYPDFAIEIWHTLSARRGTPEPVLATLRQEVAAVLTSEPVRARITAMGVDATPTLAEPAEARVQAELARWVPLIREAGISTE